MKGHRPSICSRTPSSQGVRARKCGTNLLEAAGLDGSYTSVWGAIRIKTSFALVGASLGRALDPRPTTWCAGSAAAPCRCLADSYPPVLRTSSKRRGSFVLTLNDIIHPEVRKIYPGADVPVFRLRCDVG